MEETTTPTKDLKFHPQELSYSFSSENLKKSNKLNKLIIIFILIVLFIALLTFIAIFLFSNSKTNETKANQTPQQVQKTEIIDVTKKILRASNLESNNNLNIDASLKRIKDKNIEVFYLGNLYGLKLDNNSTCHMYTSDNSSGATNSALNNKVYIPCSNISRFLGKDVIINFKIINNENIIKSLTF